MGNLDYKFALVNSGYLKKTSTKNEYRTNCPYCGETDKKFYMNIDLDSDSPIRYRCFKCPARGNQVSEDLLRRFGITNVEIPKDAKIMKSLLLDSGVRVSDTIRTTLISEDDDLNSIRYYLKKMIHIEPDISMNDLLSFQYIGNPYSFVKDYLGDAKIDMLHGLHHWFKIGNGNMMTYSPFDNKPIEYVSRRIKTKGLYQMKTPIDLCQEVNVLIGDDILDMIGLYYNYTNDQLTNRMYIGCLGMPYVYGMYHMLGKGVFGKSVNIHIFLNNSIKERDVIIGKDIRSLFNRVWIYGNTNYKGYRVSASEMNIQKLGKR